METLTEKRNQITFINDISLDFINDYCINDMGDEYFSDLITEYADSFVDTYSYDLIEWGSEEDNIDYIQEYINEYLCSNKFDYFELLRGGQFICNESQLNEDLPSILLYMAYDYLINLGYDKALEEEQIDNIIDICNDCYLYDTTIELKEAIQEVIQEWVNE